MNREDFKIKGEVFPVPMSNKFFSLVKDIPAPNTRDYSYGCVSFEWKISQDKYNTWYDVNAVLEENGNWRLVHTSNPMTHGCLQYTIKDSTITYDHILYWCLLKMDAFVKGIKGYGQPLELDREYVSKWTKDEGEEFIEHDIWEHYLKGAQIKDNKINGVPPESILKKRSKKIRYDRWDSAERLLIESYNKKQYNFFMSLAKYMDPDLVYEISNQIPRFLSLAVQGGLDMRSMRTRARDVLDIVSSKPPMLKV